MRVYWRKVRRGENLILSDENDGHEEELGGFRDTKRGIDALAKTFSYDPSRSRNGFPSIEEAKDFVESFRPWELFGAQGVTVDPGVRPALDSATTDTAGNPAAPVFGLTDETLANRIRAAARAADCGGPAPRAMEARRHGPPATLGARPQERR